MKITYKSSLFSNMCVLCHEYEMKYVEMIPHLENNTLMTKLGIELGK